MGATSPILISMVQYHDALSAGTLDVLGVIDAARRLGADGVELRADYWRDRDREIAAARLAAGERGLLVTYATSATLFPDGADGAARFRRDVDDAIALGARLLRVFQGAAPPAADEPAWARARRAVGYGEEQGMVLALENFARAPGSRLAEIARTLDAIDSPALGTNVDVGNYALNGEDVPAVVRALGPRVIASHLKDAHGAEATFLGGGSLPLPAILEAFDRLPQAVTHCFEFEGGGDPDGRIATSLAYLREFRGQVPR